MKKFSAIILAVLVMVTVALLYVFIPAGEQVSTELPAMIMDKETGQFEAAAFKIDGQWSKSRVSSQSLGFTGQFQIDALQYTVNENWKFETELNAVEGAQYLQGFLPYKSAEGELESAVLYVNSDHTAYVYYDSKYIAFAPAENEDEAYLICKQLGLTYPG